MASSKAPARKSLFPPVEEVTNGERANWAYLALERFARATNQDNSGDLKHDRGTVVNDLLCDLMHLCDRDGLDFEDLVERARGHYQEELVEEKELNERDT